jgi:hypothetical protein
MNLFVYTSTSYLSCLSGGQDYGDLQFYTIDSQERRMFMVRSGVCRVLDSAIQYAKDFPIIYTKLVDELAWLSRQVIG